MNPFKNEPFVNYQNPENRQAMLTALQSVEKSLGKTYPLVIGGEKIETGDLITSVNPANKSQVIGKVHGADVALANRAVEVAHKTFESWKKTDAKKRSDYLLKAAAIIRDRKHEFNAGLVYEVGKTWGEADAETAEAIDFLEFYAEENLRYANEQPLTPLEGEKNQLHYIPLGVAIVIPPWNFPFAIMAGMTMAAVVTGNTVVLKPSSEAPWIAQKFFEVLEAIQLPAGVVNFLPGRGGQVGDALTQHKLTRLVAFTGSKAVGLRINELAAKTVPGQIWIKRVIAEMGGKDSIVVDSEADLEAAADGVVRSAFGYSGQKCSACSRAIIDAKVYDVMVEKIRTKTAALTMGDPRDDKNAVGPVVSERAYRGILDYIEVGKKEGKLLNGGKAVGNEGFFIEPTVIKDIQPEARLSQEEIFGPVLALIKANDFDHALQIANNTEYGLTGAFYSKNESKISRALQEIHVGNLYINRKCTGALVGVHPFGGFNMSGTDSKAGGRDYLGLFMQAKLTSRKIT